MHITDTRTSMILEALSDKHDAEWCGEYGEQGYSNPEAGVIFANWNNIGKLIQVYLESAGFELEWSDEWMIAYPHDKAYRTQPDSYSWVCQVAYTEHGDPITPDDEPSEWIEHCEITDPTQEVRNALPDHVTTDQLEAEGFVKVDKEFQDGWYDRHDNPSDIVSQLWNDVDNIDSVVFKIDSTGQFHTNFTAWYKAGE